VIRVVLVDDDELVRSGLAMIIDSADDIEVCAQASSGRDGIEAVRRHRPDVVLMDLRMPGMDGVEATAQLMAMPDVDARVVVVTTFDDDRHVLDALRAGASGYLLKRSRPTELLDGIRLVADGDGLLSPSVTRQLIERIADHHVPDPDDARSLDRLTEREREVLVRVAQGLNNAEIADQLHISESTAKTHLKRLMMKLDLRDRVAAVVFAYENGLIRPGATH
jgi:DNA-binding NarL/FixJ family response regulator